MSNWYYYSTQNGATYQCMDYGEHWVEWTNPAPFVAGLQEMKRYGNRLCMEWRHSSGRDSLYLSENEGASWSNMTGNLDATDFYGGGFVEHDGYLFYSYRMGAMAGIQRYALSTSVVGNKGLIQGSAYPNPVDDMLTIELAPKTILRTWVLVDATGRTMANGRVTGNVERIDMAALQPGCYLLRWDDTGATALRVVKH